MGRPRTVGDVFRGARAPYSHMDEEDARLFYSTMNALLVYANERLRVVSPELLRERPGNPDMLYENGAQVAEGRSVKPALQGHCRLGLECSLKVF